MIRRALFAIPLLWLSVAFTADEVVILPGTQALTWSGDLSAKMLDGVHRYLDRKTAESIQHRQQYWNRDLSSPRAYEKSVEPNRQRLRTIIGAVDQRLPVVVEKFGDEDNPALVAETDRYQMWQVRWPVLDGVFGEGLLLEPRNKPTAHVVVLPDADQTPEQIVGLAPGVRAESQFARRLAEAGCQVLVPQLVNRAAEFSGHPQVRLTNLTHREWIYRQAFEMGRHTIGYEVQEVLALVDWFRQHYGDIAKVGVAGYGEGGLIALYSAAVDTRIDVTLVTGYFGPRELLWQEPIYRNVWGLLREFGDAEIATLLAPRRGLVVEYSTVPNVSYPAPDGYDWKGRWAAPGKLVTPPFESVLAEFKRVDTLMRDGFYPKYLVHGPDGAPTGPGSSEAMGQLARLFSLPSEMPLSDRLPIDRRKSFNPLDRQKRQVRQLERHVQWLLNHADEVRDQFFINKVSRKSVDAFVSDAKKYKRYLWEEVIGRLDDPLPSLNPRTRKVYDTPKWVGYEVVLDVWPEVFAWGILCVPRDLKQNEKRPVVVCQHGWEGLPRDTIEETRDGQRYYRQFAARLADRGFVTFAPHNPYRGAYRYLEQQRKANPLKASIGSVILAQHEQILRWLGSLPFADKDRIAYYGLSYGGEMAVRIPPLLDGYSLSISSACFNDWVRKVAISDSKYSYMYNPSYEKPQWNAGHTFNDADMAYLMIPRPFMVERGHDDEVAPDSWVAYEYAKVRRLYNQLGIGDRTEIEFFNGGHWINGQGTFEFLRKHLNWPKR